ncbi:MAG: molecular chaperone DnaK, partial [Bacillota bacterium]|nr:molecular chaperone DnaK [Bacillota bacterium]
GQTSVEIHVLQGEREMAAFNKTLGRFELTGIPPAPRGVPKIEVTFDIDANGIVHVSAKDLGTGKQQAITIKSSSGLTEEEIKRMAKEAEEHAAEDRKLREAAEAKNQADALAYNAEKTLKDAEGKVDAALVNRVREAVSKVKELLKGNDTEAIKKASEELSEALYAVSSALYSKAGENPGGGQSTNPGSAGPQSGNVYDAQYKVDDEKK